MSNQDIQVDVFTGPQSPETTWCPTSTMTGFNSPVNVTDQIAQLQATISGLSSGTGSTVVNNTTVTGGGGTPPGQVTLVSAVESPYKSRTGDLFSLVSVSFTPPVADPNFSGVEVWFQNYNGSTNWQLMSQGSTSPLSFLCDTTNETVTVKVVSYSAAGASADLAAAPSCTVLLDGVTSAPPSPTIAQNSIITPVGFQFAFNYLTGLVADTIDGYWIYRSADSTFAHATQVKFVKNSPQNSGQYVFQETIPTPDGVQYYYWVTAVNTSGLESTPTLATTVPDTPITVYVPTLVTTAGNNLLTNADFEVGVATKAAPAWSSFSNAYFSYGGAYTGSRSYGVVNTSTAMGTCMYYQRINCSPGDKFQLSGAIWCSTGCSGYIGAIFYHSTSPTTGTITGTDSIASSANSWNFQTKTTIAAPANTTYVVVFLVTNAGSVGANCYFDAVALKKLESFYSDGTSVDSLRPNILGSAGESIVQNGDFLLGTTDGWGVCEGSGSYSYTNLGGVNGLLISGTGVGVGSPSFRVVPGQKYRVTFRAWATAGTQGTYLRFNYASTYYPLITASNRASLTDFIAAGTIATTATDYTYDWTAPAGANYVSACVYNWTGSTATLKVQWILVVPYQAVSQWGADVTAYNTAANIAGQGALATQSTVNLGSQTTGTVSLDTQVSDGTQYARPLANQLQLGVVTGVTYGRNFCPNGGFESNDAGRWGSYYSSGVLLDEWSMQANSGQFVGGWSTYCDNSPTSLALILDLNKTIAASSSAYCAAYSTPFTVRPGDTLLYTASVGCSQEASLPTGVTATADTWVRFSPGGDYGNLSQAVSGFVWSKLGASNRFTVPNGAGTAVVYTRLTVNNTNGTPFNTGSYHYAVAYFDNLMLVNITDLANEVSSRGAIPPSLSGSLSYTCTSSRITWSWTGLTILRADGTTTSIADNSVACTGLSANTRYYFYPYYDETAGTVSFVTGGTGSTGTAFTATGNATASQQQNLLWHIPLSSGPMSGSTTSSGSGGGSGGGNGQCVRTTMLVREKTKGVMPAGEVQVGDYLSCPEGWTRVEHAKVAPNDMFMRVTAGGETLEVTPWHPFTAMDEACDPIDCIEAARLTCMHQLYTVDGASFVEELQLIRVPGGEKSVITCEDGKHTFYAGTREPFLLAHNQFVSC